MRAMVFLFFCGTTFGQTFQGDVVNAISRAPVAGAFISTTSATGRTIVVRSDSAGHFRFTESTEPRRKDPYVRVERAGFLPRTISLNDVVPKREIELRPAGVISGKVADADGAPARKVLVAAVWYRMVDGRRVLGIAGTGQTDDVGEYRIGGLATGRYWVRVHPGDLEGWDRRYAVEYYPGTVRLEDAKQLEVRVGQERQGVDLKLSLHAGVTIAAAWNGTRYVEFICTRIRRIRRPNGLFGRRVGVSRSGTFHRATTSCGRLRTTTRHNQEIYSPHRNCTSATSIRRRSTSRRDRCTHLR